MSIARKMKSCIALLAFALALVPALALGSAQQAFAEAPAAIDYDGDAINFIKADGAGFGMWSDLGNTTVSTEGDKLVVHYDNKNTTTYKGFYLEAGIDDPATRDEAKWFPVNDEGKLDFTLDMSYCGKAWPVAPIKWDPNASGNSGVVSDTTGTQYYLAIPSKDKLGILDDGLYTLDVAVDGADGIVDNESFPASLFVKGSDEFLVAKILDPSKYDGLYKGTVDGRPAADAEGAYIPGLNVLDEYLYVAVPVTAADVQASKIPFSLHTVEGAWANEADCTLTLSNVAKADVDVKTWIPDADDIAEVIDLTNKIGDTPTYETYAAAREAYIELDYSGTQDYGRAFIDEALTEVSIALDEANDALPDVVPDDGVYEFMQTLEGYNYPTCAVPFVSDSLWSGTLVVEDGKMTVTVSQRRGSYSYLYVGTPSEATADETAYQAETGVTTIGKNANGVAKDRLLDNMPGAHYFWNVTDVFLDNPQTGTSPVDDSIEYDGAGVYPMFTATFEIESLEKPIAMSFRGSRWFNRSFLFTQENMYKKSIADVIRPINAVLNSPDPDDVESLYDPYKVDAEAVSLDDAAMISDADTAYKALDADDKAVVDVMKITTTPEDVEDAQTYPEALEAAKTGLVAEVKEAIEDLPAASEVNPDDAEDVQAEVDELKEVLAALNDDLKAEVGADEAQAKAAAVSAAADKTVAVEAAAAAAVAADNAAEAVKTAEASQKAAEQAAKTPGEAAVKAAQKAAEDAAAAQAAVANAEAAAAAADAAIAKAKANDAITGDDAAAVTAAATQVATAKETAAAAKTAADAAAATAATAVESATKAAEEKAAADKAAAEAKAAAEKKAKSVKKVTVNAKKVTAKAISTAVKKAGGKDQYVQTIVLGPKVKTIAKNAFKGFKAAKTVQIKSTKIKNAKSVKNCFKGSKVKTVKVPKKKLKAYKKYFAKKNCGAKVKVKK